MTRSKTVRPASTSAEKLSAARFGLALSGLVATTGCVTTVTPPESTPVYAEELSPSADPIPVKKSSVDTPDSSNVKPETPETETDEIAPSSTEEPTEEASEESAPSKQSAPAPEKKEAPKAAEAKPKGKPTGSKKGSPAKKQRKAPAKKASTKKSKGDSEGGCGQGTCG